MVTVQEPDPARLRRSWAEDEGARRDIYVSDTSGAEWQRVIEALSGWSHSYTEAGESARMPQDVAEIFRRRSDRSILLELHLTDRLSLEAYFFEQTQIEFTFDPHEVVDDADVYRLLDFVRHLGRVLARPVHMTIESFPGKRPVDDLRYDPAADRIVAPG